ncbi:hypothetical protein NLU13_9497 [Sarocladium strictum]|uniref:ATP-dependent DNA ligase family profile domain-containing protein n=1 Tax=Sarocladium strictum TaxID=5046 RepID=A0AA39GAK8_SARSR|nr:hypothetical protein NLU13_9497 [Sarocladium strictum]
MPLPFTFVCDLLEQCSKICAAGQDHHSAVVKWFNRHRTLIDAHDTNVAALLSTLLPEKRTDRVYCIQTASLEKIIGRALMLGSSRIKELALHKIPGKGVDLADCVERILVATPNPEQSVQNIITVEYVDALLHAIASRIKWSSPKVRHAKTSMTHESRVELEALYLRLSPREAKWFTRLILKNYEPLIFQPEAIYSLCDRALPSALKIRDDFVAAIDAVQYARTRLLPNTSRGSFPRNSLLSVIKPQHGIKVGRQPWLKARSIKHCLDMGHGKMSVEKKIDGEYCQIHIDLSNPRSPIQIFSKSGKDSTEDRRNLHSAMMDSLRDGHSGFTIKQKCILEGELVVYSDAEQRIRPFHTIRKYVTRRGRFLNTDQDSQPKSYEHLMIVYFDILSIDETSLLGTRHSERRKHLERVIKVTPGRSEIVTRQVIDFDHRLAASHLRKAFAAVIVQRDEGLVLKPDDPYFDFSSNQRRYASCSIKLKKEYIGNFGEIGDLAVVGAGFSPVRAKSYKIPGLKWTHFYLGCLNNKEEVVRWAAKPTFTVVSLVELNSTLLKSFITHGHTEAVPAETNEETIIKLAPGLDRTPSLEVAFTRPPVVDVRCFSFDKEGNTGFWTPRFPGVSKIHFDRDFTNTITFDELQSMAQNATSTTAPEDSQENLQWIARLERADPRGVAVDAISQLTASSLATPPQWRRTQSVSDISCPTSPTTSRSQPQVGCAAAHIDLSAIPLKLTRQAAPLTPPTSSAPQKSSPDSKRKGTPTKRYGEASMHGSRPKRQKLHKPMSASTLPMSASTLPKPAPTSARCARSPLGDIEGNSSQRANPPEGPALVRKDGVVIDLTASSIASQSSSCSLLDENDSCVDAGTSSKAGVQAYTAVIDGSQQCKPETKGLRCKLAGSKCQFRNSVVVLAPYLREDQPLITRLADHGIHEHPTDLQAVTSLLVNTQGNSDMSVILLVDSVEKVQQTRLVLDELERILVMDLAEGRSWVHVYDWRILDSIANVEIEDISRADMSGFRDPWRRWQVGVL